MSTNEPRRRLGPWAKLALLAAILAGGLALSSWLFGEDLRSPTKLAKRLDELVSAMGVLAPLAFILMLAPGILPAIPMAIAAGAIFGPVWGTIWGLTGNVIGAVVTFYAGRALGKDFVDQYAKGKLLLVKETIEREGWRFVAFVRLVPILPWAAINMALGTTTISLRSYAITTAIFMAPGAAVYAWIGHSGRKAAEGSENTLRNVSIAAGLLLLLVGIPAVLRGVRYRRKLREPPST